MKYCGKDFEHVLRYSKVGGRGICSVAHVIDVLPSDSQGRARPISGSFQVAPFYFIYLPVWPFCPTSLYDIAEKSIIPQVFRAPYSDQCKRQPNLRVQWMAKGGWRILRRVGTRRRKIQLALVDFNYFLLHLLLPVNKSENGGCLTPQKDSYPRLEEGFPCG